MSIDYIDFKYIFEITVAMHFPTKLAGSILNQINWDSWIKQTGYPPIKFNFGIY